MIPDIGMGLQFMQMRAEDRAKLSRFLLAQEAASAPQTARQATASSVPGPGATTNPGGQLSFEIELKQLLELAQKGTYYQLLGITAASTTTDIKKSFYSVARKFHPDHHMAKGELIGSLQTLMEVVTQAYKTLTDEEKRAVYDKNLVASGAFSLNRGKTEARETLEDCLAKASEYLRARNFTGSVVWLRKCVEIAPNDPKYHALLARSLGTVAPYRDEAIRHFEKAIELDPWNVKVQYQFAELCETMRLPARARGLYSKILEIDPTHSKALERLAELAPREKAGTTSSVISRIFGSKS